MHTLESIARIKKSTINNLPEKSKVQKANAENGKLITVGTENSINLSAYEKRQAIARYKAVHQKNAVERLFKAICS